MKFISMKLFLKCSGVLFSLFFVFSCKNNSCGAIQTAERITIKSSEVINGDTVNRMDTEGRKQGVWYILHKNRHSISDTVVYRNGVVVE